MAAEPINGTDQTKHADILYEQYANPLEETYQGEYVAISEDGNMVLAPTLRDVLDKAVERFGPGSYIFKVGEKVVWTSR